VKFLHQSTGVTEPVRPYSPELARAATFGIATQISTTTSKTIGGIASNALNCHAPQKSKRGSLSAHHLINLWFIKELVALSAALPDMAQVLGHCQLPHYMFRDTHHHSVSIRSEERGTDDAPDIR
jgi:hypothetical protein